MGYPRGVVLRKEMEGVAGAREARISLLTCDRGWEGCRRKTIGGGRFALGSVPSLDFLCVCSNGMISLNKWDAVGESFPDRVWNI